MREPLFRHIRQDTGNAAGKEETAPLKKVLHVGCGGNHGLPHPYFCEGEWEDVRLDIDPDQAPDIVADMRDLSMIPKGSYEGLYSSHNLEHVFTHEVLGVLQEFHRVLKRDGMLILTMPDIQAVAEKVAQGGLNTVLYESPAGPIKAIDILHGHTDSIARGNRFMAHRTSFTAHSLAEYLVQAGFRDITVKRQVSSYSLWAIAHHRGPPPDRGEVVEVQIGMME